MRTSFRDKRDMSAFDQAVRGDLDNLIDLRARSAGSKDFAKEAIARETKVPLGTLSNIRKSRLKGIKGWVGEAIRGALLRELQREMQRLQHEYEVILRRGVDRHNDEMAEIAADLAKVRQALDTVK